MSSAHSAEVGIVEGAAARSLLDQPAFIAAWEALEQSCAWSTPFQRAAFSTAWYSTYSDNSPLLLFRGEPTGVLRALFPLALLRDGRLTVAGAQQAEYQGWIALPGEDDFIVAALERLKASFPVQRLSLQFLPPGIPSAALDRDPRWGLGRRLIARTVARSLMRLDPAEASKSLKKSGNRSKLNRLKQLGAVRLDRLTRPEDLAAAIEDVATYCDLRQCAVNGVMPFRDDPRKKAFYLALLERAGLLHATVLRVGDRIAAAHLGVASSRDVALGVIAHSPFLAAHSPGKMLLLLLGAHLADEGFEYLDLTPEGAYKDRFASHADEVETRVIYFSRSAFLRARFVAAGRRVAKRVALATGRIIGLNERALLDYARRLRYIASDSLPRTSRTVAARLLHLHRRNEARVYRMSAAAARALESVEALSRDSIEHLLSYEPVDAHARPRQLFCRQAIERLERGEHVYTRLEEGRIVHAAWLIPPEPDGTSSLRERLGLEPRSAVLYDGYTHPIARDRNLQKQSLVQRAKDAATLSSADWIYVASPDGSDLSPHSMEQLGFELVDKSQGRVQSGRVGQQ